MPFGLGFFATAGAGAAGSFDLLETQVLGSTQASVTFSSLGSYSGYKHLQIRMTNRSSGTGAPSTYMRLNSDTAGNYSTHYLFTNGGGAVESGNQTSSTGMLLHTTNSSSHTANAFGAGVTDLLDAFDTTKNKTIRTFGGQGAIGSPTYVNLASGSWRNTAAIASITIYLDSGSFIANSRFSLYGIKGA